MASALSRAWKTLSTGAIGARSRCPARGVIELEPLADAGAVLLRLRLDDLRDLGLVVQRSRGLFDLDADPVAIGAALGADPLLAPLVAARPGLRMPGAMDGFELATRAILGQQVSVAGARTLAGRLVAALGEPLAEPHDAFTHFSLPPRGSPRRIWGAWGSRAGASSPSAPSHAPWPRAT